MRAKSATIDLGRAIRRETIISRCESYRYCLWREWEDRSPRYVAFIGLNPSTADAVNDDPTIRRCIGFATRWGYSSMCMINLFAFRATKPADLRKSEDPIGSANDDFLRELSKSADLVVSCWGNHGSILGRQQNVVRFIGISCCLGVTNQGQPKHPLYVPYETELMTYSPLM